MIKYIILDTLKINNSFILISLFKYFSFKITIYITIKKKLKTQKMKKEHREIRIRKHIKVRELRALTI